MMSGYQDVPVPARELSVSFGYQCNTSSPITVANECDFSSEAMVHGSSMKMMSSSFSCLSGAALSANATLANTNICNGLIGEEILPSLDSPNSFKKMPSSPSLPKFDLVSSSSNSSMTTLGRSMSVENDFCEIEKNSLNSTSAPTRSESSSFLNAMDTQMAGGAAGEDRVQAVCSEENGWLFCGIYDGFNGRDAADFLAGTLYESIGFHLNMLEWRAQKQFRSLVTTVQDDGAIRTDHKSKSERKDINTYHSFDKELAHENFRHGVLDCLNRGLAQAESDFMNMVEQEMEERPDLVSVGSCVLVALLHGNDIYILNLGDSRAVLAVHDIRENGAVKAIQLTESHSVDNELECRKILADHPEDPSSIFNGRVKGKLKLTRAFGVGYLKKREMNDALMGILRVQNLCSPPYVYTQPSTISHRVSNTDRFLILGSDGLFDFFSNNEVVQLVHLFIEHNPLGDPAKYLIEKLVDKAADNAGFTTAQELMRIPAGRRRKYHDDVTIIVIILGNRQRTTTATTSL